MDKAFDLKDFLSGIKLFQNVAPTIIEELVGLSTFKHVPRYSPMPRRGQEIQEFFLVVAGCLYLQRSLKDREIVVGIAEAGQLVGNLNALLGSGVWTMDVLVPGDAFVLVIPIRVLRGIIESNPRIALNLFGLQEQYLEYARGVAITFVERDVERRIYRYLAGLIQGHLIKDLGRERGIIVGGFPDQMTLSKVLCCSREHANRILRRWVEENKLEYQSRRSQIRISPVLLILIQQIIEEESGEDSSHVLRAPVLTGTTRVGVGPLQLTGTVPSRILPPASAADGEIEPSKE